MMKKGVMMRIWFLFVIFTCIVIGIVSYYTLVFAEMDTTKAVIHHTASSDVSIIEINRWHKERGWDGIGYHFVIRADGTIEEGRSITKQGAHAKGRNHYIGIVLTGYDNFTKSQITSLIKLLKDLNIRYIERHHEKCPGQGIDLEQVQKEVCDEKIYYLRTGSR